MRKKKNYLKLFSLIFMILFCCAFQTIVYSAINGTMTVKGDAYARAEADVRITGFSIYETGIDTISSYEEYSKNSITTNVNFPKENSYIIYRVEVTNYGMVPAGIASITGINEGLDYELIDYSLKEQICDNYNNCTTLAKKTFYIKIFGTPGIYDISLNFEFKVFHKITYEQITNNNYPIYVFDGEDLNVNFTQTFEGKVGVKNDDGYVPHSISNNNLSIENVSSNLTIYIETNLFNIVRLSANNIADNYSDNKEYQTYYYNYSETNNNIKFANFCWKGIKTTEAGGVSLIYNGVPSADGSCNNNGEASQIGKTTFLNYSGDYLNFYSQITSLSSIGYMYGETYAGNSVTLSDDYEVIHYIYPGTSNYYYSNSYVYENGQYTLQNPEQKNWSENYATLNGYYSCNSNTNTSCSSLYYTIAGDSNRKYSIVLANGKTYDEASKMTLSKNYIENQDGTYTLNNPITINKSSWLSDYEKYNNYFICPEFNNSSCANIIQIASSTNTNFNDGKHEKYIYGNDIEYQNGTYTLKDTFASDSWALDYNEISKKYHYTCLNTTGTCTDVNYIYLYDIEGPKYIILSNGDNVEDAKSKMFANNTDSHIKTYIDSWYENNLKRYSAMIEDSPYCFNREIYFSSLKSKDFNFSESENIGGLAYGDYGKFYDYAFKNLNNIEEEPTEDEWRQIISKIDFSCTNKNDIFSVRDKNGNGKLKYPIGMLSFSDILKTNNLFFASEEDISFLNSGGSDYFIVPTGLYAGVAIQITYNLETNIGYQESGVRPVITVKVGAEVVSGNGDAMNPFVLNEEYLTDSTTGTEAINLISFTIDDNLFYAEKEMTWSEWIESEYNTIGATTTSESDFIYTYRGTLYSEHKAICTVKNNIYTYMTKNTVVKPNVSYIISHLGAGD